MGPICLPVTTHTHTHTNTLTHHCRPLLLFLSECGSSLCPKLPYKVKASRKKNEHPLPPPSLHPYCGERLILAFWNTTNDFSSGLICTRSLCLSDIEGGHVFRPARKSWRVKTRRFMCQVVSNADPCVRVSERQQKK